MWRRMRSESSQTIKRPHARTQGQWFIANATATATHWAQMISQNAC